MTSYARIVDGIVAEVIDWDPEGRYPPEWVWIECPDDTRQFATYADGVFTNPAPSAPDPLAARKADMIGVVDAFAALFREAIAAAPDAAALDAIEAQDNWPG